MSEPDQTVRRFACPKCQAEMEQGFLLEANECSRYMSQWVQGAPEFGWLGGVKAGGDRERRNVLAMRCTRCGFLEFYTSDETIQWPDRY